MRSVTCGLCLTVALLAFGFALPGGLLAHTGATGIVKERMELMKSVGAAMKTLAKMFKGEEPYDADAVRKAATQIQGHGGETMTKLFPEGSLDKPTEALPTIWEDWERFELLAAQLVDYSGALAKAANNPQGAGGAGMMGRGGGMRGQACDQAAGQGCPGPRMGRGARMGGQGCDQGGGQACPGPGMGRGAGMGGQGCGQGAGQDCDGPMMGRRGPGPDPEHLATRPPQAAFVHLTQTCRACHAKFREKKEE